MNNLGLYIHIPFCASKCAYCAFNSVVAQDYNPYIKALVGEIEAKAQKYSQGRVLDSIYFGGGTPSLLSQGQFSLIFKTIKSNFTLYKDCEITVEVNPASADFDKLSYLKEEGVNRISLGLQCANDGILKVLRRPHNTKQFTDTLSDIKRAGIENFSADVMIGLPSQTLKDIEKTLDLCVDCGVSHLSCYALKIERGTPFYRQKAHLKLPDDDMSADMYDFCLSYLTHKGLNRYEISNFAKEGYRCRHNLKYWKSLDYLAAGVSAGGFISHYRYQNIKDIDKYIYKIDKGEKVSYGKKLNKEELMFEYLMMALRLDEGFSLTDFKNRFNVSFEEVYGPKAQSLLDKGFLTEKENFISLPQDKSGVLNSILIDLLF